VPDVDQSLTSQFVNLLAAFLLLIAFAMLSQRRVLTLIKLFAWQGATLALSTAIVAYSTGQTHLYFSAGLTVLLKVILIPWVLHRLIDRLYVRWDVETLINIPATMLIGIVLVIFAFNLATPISQFAGTITKSTLGIATASILLSFLMMITRRKAVSQVIGFLTMENGLFFAATSATYGMPMVVELGIALDVLVGSLISILEPVMVVVLGVIVGFIVVALFMPMVGLIEGITNQSSKK
jgi:hydrogenase-4 component E